MWNKCRAVCHWFTKFDKAHRCTNIGLYFYYLLKINQLWFFVIKMYNAVVNKKLML